MNKIKAIENKNIRSSFSSDKIPEDFSKQIGRTARNFHGTFPQYNVTPLIQLNDYARHLGLNNILVKDESCRFGLKAFKILGGSFAIGKLISQRLDVPIEELSYDRLRSKEMKNQLGNLIFCTASDGNHGRGVAFAATQLGFGAVVYLPLGTVKSRIDAIEETGAEVIVTDFNYDQSVEFAAMNAKENGWELIQDSSWPEYTEIPLWIMQGYLTMALEILEQMREMDINRPTHIFLQAGVGSMAAAALGGFINEYRDNYPIAAIIEPTEAACFYDSFVKNDGNPHPATGNLRTIMAGLSCGIPSKIAWEIIQNFADIMIACEDTIAAEGMRIYARPLGNDPKIISGESGAVAIGLLTSLMRDAKYSNIRDQLRLDKNSTVLLLNTEGDTDPENYLKIVS